MKIISIMGVRSQFIKCAPLFREMREVYLNRYISHLCCGEFHPEILVHTVQHYDPDMSDFFFHEPNMPKLDYNLRIGSGNHGEQTGKKLTEIEKVILKENPESYWSQVHEFNTGRDWSFHSIAIN